MWADATAGLRLQAAVRRQDAPSALDLVAARAQGVTGADLGLVPTPPWASDPEASAPASPTPALTTWATALVRAALERRAANPRSGPSDETLLLRRVVQHVRAAEPTATWPAPLRQELLELQDRPTTHAVAMMGGWSWAEVGAWARGLAGLDRALAAALVMSPAVPRAVFQGWFREALRMPDPLLLIPLPEFTHGVPARQVLEGALVRPDLTERDRRAACVRCPALVPRLIALGLPPASALRWVEEETWAAGSEPMRLLARHAITDALLDPSAFVRLVVLLGPQDPESWPALLEHPAMEALSRAALAPVLAATGPQARAWRLALLARLGHHPAPDRSAELPRPGAGGPVVGGPVVGGPVIGASVEIGSARIESARR